MTLIAIAIVVAHGKTLVIVWHHLNKEIINRQVDLSSFEGQLLEKIGRTSDCPKHWLHHWWHLT